MSLVNFVSKEIGKVMLTAPLTVKDELAIVFNPASLVPASLKRPDSHTYIYCVKEHCQWWVKGEEECAVVVLTRRIGTTA